MGIVIAADQIDIDYAKLAMSKAKDQQVRDFAQQMTTDHSAVQKSGGKPVCNECCDFLRKQKHSQHHNKGRPQQYIPDQSAADGIENM